MLRTVALAFAALFLTAAIATGATSDKGRRLTGPVCISKSTGVIRSIAVTNVCRKGEVRRVGLGLPPIVGPAGPAGKDGAAGAAGGVGPAGANGTNGANGANGKDASVHVTQNEDGSVTITGSDGSSATIKAPTCNCCPKPKDDKHDHNQKPS